MTKKIVNHLGIQIDANYCKTSHGGHSPSVMLLGMATTTTVFFFFFSFSRPAKALKQ